jgi:hypothetical protein
LLWPIIVPSVPVTIILTTNKATRAAWRRCSH